MHPRDAGLAALILIVLLLFMLGKSLPHLPLSESVISLTS